MALFVLLGVIVLITVVVLAVLFFLLNKEGQKEEKVVPVTDMAELKKELSSQLFEQNNTKVIENGSEIIPVFSPKTSLPTQEVKVSPEDEAYKKRAQKLEDELLAISKKADGQSGQAQQMIAALTQENESLKIEQAKLQQAQQKLVELEGEASYLKTENAGLQIKLDSTSSQVRLLEEEMATVKLQMGEEISRAKATVDELTREKEALLSAPKPEADEGLRAELETLRSEHAQLKQKYDDLYQKNEAMQYELIKARAQSSGLERVSFNYKNQLEDFLKKVNAMQESNEHLAQVKNRLEGVLQEVKLQNEELTQKDHLIQFELEKNRSRLVSLEQQYEELKARQQDQ